MKILANKYKFINFFTLTLVFFFFELVYKTFVFSKFEYMGFQYSFDLFKYIEAKFIFFSILVFVTIKTPSKFIYAIISIFLLFMFIPALVIFEFVPSNKSIIYLMSFFIILLHLSGFVSMNFKLPKISEKQSIYLVLFFAIMLLLPIFAQYKFNLNFNVLKFQDIYEVRSQSHVGLPIIGYFYNWLVKVIIPVLLAFSLIKKRYMLTVFSVVVLMYLFVAQAHKSVFFGVFIVLFFYLKKDYYKKITYFVLALLLVFVLTHLLTLTTGIFAPESILIRRVFFVPALLNTYYFEFFDNNHIYLSHSIFKSFFVYPYEVPPPAVIGMEYFNSDATNANNGFFSDGFMNFGYFGVLLYSIFVVFLFKFFDALKIDSRYFGIFFVIIFTLISSAFLTSLLTHGILVLIILALFIMQRKN